MSRPPYLKFCLFIVAFLSLPLALAACGGETSPAPATTSAATTAVRAGETPGQAATTATSGVTTAANTLPTSPPAINDSPATTVAAVTTAAAAATVGETGDAAKSSGGSAGAAASTTAAAAAGSGAFHPTAPAAPAPDYRNVQPPVNQEPVKAGAVDDNLKFSEYLQYLRDYRGPAALPFDVTERYIINVLDGNARSVANSQVKVYGGKTLLYEAKTYSNGQALFFPRALTGANQYNRFEVVAEKNGRSVTRTFDRLEPGQSQSGAGGATWTLELAGSLRPQIDPPPNLDLLFLLDSTGSMEGEIRKLQQTINDIAYQISSLPGSPRVRYGVVTYRDRGDAYITRKFGFTASLGEFSSFLNSISAGGGGDKPESVNEALHVAIQDMNWNSGEAVRLVFLVADAAPHLDYPQDYRYTDEIQQAVRKGIKVYSIGASGLEKQGEYVFRQLAQLTLAQYIFITRGGDEHQPGSGGPASSTNTVYEERNLDRIVVNLVRRELTNLTQ